MNYIPLEFDFVHEKENNSFSQGILEANRPHLNNQCRKVLDLLLKGEELTVRSAMIEYNISSLPRRILDIEQKIGYTIPQKTINKKYAVWFLREQDKIMIEEILNK